MEYILLIFCSLIGFICGVLASKPKTVGFLRIDYSDKDDGPYLFLELKNNGFEVIQSSDYVNLKVSIKDSQK